MTRRFLAVVVLCVLLAGCSRPTPSSVAPSATRSSATSTTVETSTPAGDYPEGSGIILASGNRLIVPGGWTAKVTSPGGIANDANSSSSDEPGVALYLAPPVASSTIAKASIMAVDIWVYDSQAAFDGKQSELLQNELDVRSGNTSATQEVDGVESPVRLSAQSVRWHADETSLTAYVFTETAKSHTSQYTVTVLAQGPGPDPVAIEFFVRKLPAAFGFAPVGRLPRFMMDSIGFL